MKLSLYLAFLCVLGSGFGFLSYKYLDFGFGVYVLFTFGILLALVYIFNKDINIWLHKKTRKGLAAREMEYINEHFPLLKYIPEEDRDLFYKKVSLFKADKEFMGQGMNGVPYQAILLSGAYASFFNLKTGKYEIPFSFNPVYIFYNHPFPSPQFPRSLHISERHEEDGAIIFSVPHLLKGSYEPQRFFNIGLYESAKLITISDYMDLSLPSIDELCLLGGYTLKRLEKYVGLPGEFIDRRSLAITLFYTRNDSFRQKFPVAFEKLKSLLSFSEKETAFSV